MKKILILNRERKRKRKKEKKKTPEKTNKREKQIKQTKNEKTLHAHITIVKVYGHSDLTDIILTALAVQEE